MLLPAIFILILLILLLVVFSARGKGGSGRKSLTRLRRRYRAAELPEDEDDSGAAGIVLPAAPPPISPKGLDHAELQAKALETIRANISPVKYETHRVPNNDNSGPEQGQSLAAHPIVSAQFDGHSDGLNNPSASDIAANDETNGDALQLRKSLDLKATPKMAAAPSPSTPRPSPL
jgi:hypothetical protein